MASDAPGPTDLPGVPEPKDVVSSPDSSDASDACEPKAITDASSATDAHEANGVTDSKEQKIETSAVGSNSVTESTEPENVDDDSETNGVRNVKDCYVPGPSHVTDAREPSDSPQSNGVAGGTEPKDDDDPEPSNETNAKDVVDTDVPEPNNVPHVLKHNDTVRPNGVAADVAEDESKVVDGFSATNNPADTPDSNHTTDSLEQNDSQRTNGEALETDDVADANEPDDIPDTLEPENVTDALGRDNVSDVAEPNNVTDALEPDSAVDVSDPNHVTGAPEESDNTRSNSVTGVTKPDNITEASEPNHVTDARDSSDEASIPAQSKSTDTTATSNDGVPESAQQFETQCPVCHKDYNNPKILPCAHVLCRECLVTWLRSNYPEPRSHCPVCRSEIEGSKELAFTTCEEFADALPTDLSMVLLVQSAESLTKNQVCRVCPGVTATSICLSCSDMLCETCAGSHKLLSATRNHEVEDLTSLTAERLSSIRPAACSSHPDRRCELFCSTHAVAVCHVCATSKHRACSNVTELGEKVKEAHTILGEMSAMLRSGEIALQEDIHHLDKDLLQMEKSAFATVTEVDAVCDRLEDSAKACRRRLKEEIHDKHSNRSGPVNAKKTVLSDQLGKLSSHRQLIERGDRTTPRAELWNVATTLQTCVEKLDLSVTLPPETNPKGLMKVDEKTVTEIERLLAGLQLIEVGDDSSAEEQRPPPDGVVSQEAESGGELPDCSPTLPARSGRLSFLRRSSNRGPVLRFHTNHSRNVSLGISRQSAKRTGFGGIVISSEPLMKDHLYEVRVDQTGGTATCCVMVGITSEAPDTLVLPYTAAPGWKSAIVIGPQAIWRRGVQEDSTVGQALQFLRVGTCVGVLVDGIGCLHLRVGGHCQGVVARGVTLPCYAIFDMFNDSCKKISALPVKQWASC